MPAPSTFVESPAWEGIQGEWRRIYGSFQEGLSIEWHDFECATTLDWSRSFHPDSLEICINLAGCGTLRTSPSRTHVINPQTVAHYSVGSEGLAADRHAGQKHRFFTIEISRPWLQQAISGHEGHLNRETLTFLSGNLKPSQQTRSAPLDQRLKRTTEELLHPPIPEPVNSLWFRAKALEIVSHVLIDTTSELFCQRHKRVALDRVERVKQALARDLEHPPTLGELAKEVGCSSFYLSRIFSEQTGMTISRYLRNLRLEKAAELLRKGECNVTEAAFTVGYSSLSHFSKAFAEMFGSCPCVFPLQGKKN
ncbi:MAG: hypothetical protein BGO12_13310 [Verrucomicrobia bacterium 61-8]|nr:helix-turn-helix transcriptional regulator [Verrucomicrobiota bacterium]OJV00665.1 MAG: hypothetical protein BGO12_13310 [Verrucomicrobia bacterium 61-8]